MDVSVNVSCIKIDELQYVKMTIKRCVVLCCSVAAKGGSCTGALVFTGEVVVGLC